MSQKIYLATTGVLLAAGAATGGIFGTLALIKAGSDGWLIAGFLGFSWVACFHLAGLIDRMEAKRAEKMEKSK